MTMKVFENQYRPTYELASSVAWLAAGGATQMLPHIPSNMALSVGLAAGAFGLVRGAQALRVSDRKSRLLEGGLDFITPEKFMEKISSVAGGNKLWLGEGFEWSAEEANLMNQVMSDLRGLIPEEKLQEGNHWIHGIRKGGDLTMDVTNLNGQTLLVGTTRAGKTKTLELLIMQAISRGEPVFILDPKGDKDLKETAKRACRLYGKPDLFACFHPAFPESSVKIEPMKNWNRATELASRLSALVPSETGGDPFTAFAWQQINNACQGQLLVNERPNLLSIRRLVEGGIDELLGKVLQAHLNRFMPDWRTEFPAWFKKCRNNEIDALVGLYRSLGENLAESSIDGLITAYQHNRDHFQKMIASLIPILGMLTTSPLDQLLSPTVDLDDPREIIDMESAVKTGRVIYCALDSLSDPTVGSAIGSLLLANLVAVAGAEYNYGECDTPVNLIVDEAAEIINAPMIQLLNKGGGAKFRTILAAQTFADFAARLGDVNKARQVLANCNNVIALRTLDSETQKYLSEAIPEVTIESVEVQYRHGTDGASGVGRYQGMVGETLNKTKESMFPAPMFGQLPNLHYFARLTGGRFVKGKVPILVENTKEKKYARKYHGPKIAA